MMDMQFVCRVVSHTLTVSVRNLAQDYVNSHQP